MSVVDSCCRTPSALRYVAVNIAALGERRRYGAQKCHQAENGYDPSGGMACEPIGSHVTNHDREC
jgi:hypothetical protein